MDRHPASIYVVLGSGRAVNHLQFLPGIEGHATHTNARVGGVKGVCMYVRRIYIHDTLIKCHKKLPTGVPAGRTMRRIRVKINCKA